MHDLDWAGVDTAIYTFLREFLSRPGWSQSRLAYETGLSQALISKWVHSDPKRRSTPGPEALRAIAPVVGATHRRLMELAGHLDPDEITNPETGLTPGAQRILDKARLLGLARRIEQEHDDPAERERAVEFLEGQYEQYKTFLERVVAGVLRATPTTNTLVSLLARR